MIGRLKRIAQLQGSCDRHELVEVVDVESLLQDGDVHAHGGFRYAEARGDLLGNVLLGKQLHHFALALRELGSDGGRAALWLGDQQLAGDHDVEGFA